MCAEERLSAWNCYLLAAVACVGSVGGGWTYPGSIALCVSEVYGTETSWFHQTSQSQPNFMSSSSGWGGLAERMFWVERRDGLSNLSLPT